MYIWIYFTCTHNWFKLQPLLDRFQMQTAGCCCISNLATHYEISRGNRQQLEKRQYRNKPKVRKQDTMSPFPASCNFHVYQCLEEKPATLMWGKDDSQPRAVWSSCGSIQNVYTQHSREQGLGLEQRQNVSIKMHILLLCNIGAVTCTVQGSCLILPYWNKILCYR